MSLKLLLGLRKPKQPRRCCSRSRPQVISKTLLWLATGPALQIYVLVCMLCIRCNVQL
jgi:hypothetical protein